jgi:hypothetical protein
MFAVSVSAHFTFFASLAEVNRNDVLQLTSQKKVITQSLRPIL